ncbi:MAG: hypothetical protein ABI627_09005 [Polyangiaceae bacterium]
MFAVKRVLAGALGLLLVLVLSPVSSARARPAPDADLSCIPREQCCKLCVAGKACGNTCIKAEYQCHKGRGCACDADDVCE